MSLARSINTAASYLGGRAIQLGAGLVLAKVCGPVAWGAAGSIRATFELLLVFLRGGSEQSLFKHAGGLGLRDAALVGAEIWTTTRRMALVLGMALALALGIWGSVGQELPREWIASVVVFGAAVPLLAFAQTSSSLSISVGRNNLLHAENLILPVVRLALVLVLVQWLAPLISLASAYLVASVFLAFIGAQRGITAGWWVRSDQRKLNSFPESEFASLGSNYLLSSLVSRLDLLLVGMMVGMGAAGAYAVLHSAAGIISVIGSTQGRMLAPQVGQLFRERERLSALRAVAYGRRMALMVSLPAVVGLFYLYPLIVKILGRSYEVGQTSILLIGISYAIMATFNYSGLLLSLSGRQQEERGALMLGGAALVISCALFLPWLGAPGAALACLASVVSTTAYRDRIVLRSYRDLAGILDLYSIGFTRTCAVLVPSFLAVVAKLYWGSISPAQSIAVLCLYLGAYAAVVYFVYLNEVEKIWLLKRVVRQ